MAELPDYLREFDDTAKTRQLIYDGCLEAVKNRFPVEDDTYRLELADVHYDGPQDYSLEDQKQALMKSKNLRTSMKGRWRLVHKPTNTVLGEREDTILQVPYYTDRGTIINNGNDYSIISQMRLRPGVYARRRRTGELESHFNIKSGTGRAFRFELEPESGTFKLTVGQSHVPLYPILKAIGVTDQDMMKYWGADIVAANAKQSDAQALKKTYQRMAGAKADDNANQLAMGQFIKDSIEKYQVDPEIVARTMGVETDHVTPELMLRATQKLLDINRGDAKPDNRDNPRYASVYSIEDLMRERIDKDAGRLTKSLLYKVRRDRSLNRLPKNALTPYLDSFILGSGLTMPGEETNPLSNLTQMNRISRFGEGGIRSEDAVTMEAHDVHGDWMGFVDPVAGPESMRIGVDVRASYRTFKGKDKKLYGEFINARTGKEEFVDMGTAADRVVAFPGQDMSQPYVFAMKDDVPTKVKTDTVDYVVPSFAHLYGSNTNINPMPTAVQANRQFYGSKFWEQYLPQVKGEVPLVDSLMPDGKTTFTEYYGRRIGTMRSPVDGTVVSVKDNEIIVKDGTGKKHKTTLVTGLPFNRLSSISYTPAVKVGQDVHKGDMLANSNYTDAKTGAINMGQNLRVAILPYKGQSVSGDTNVLWRYGVGNVSFGPIKNIVPGDGMASLTVDPETLEQSYAKCNALMVHKPDTKMYLVKTLHGRQVKVTGSHSMMVYDGKLGIKELNTTDLIPGQHFLPVVQPKIPFGESDSIICQSSTKSLEVKLNRDFGWLIGIFLSEGYVDVHGGSKVIDISCTEHDIVANLRRICTDLGVRHGYNEYKSVVRGKEHSQGRFKIYCSSLATWVNDHCGKGAEHKYLPDVTWTAPREFAEGLIDAYICGDGSIGKECRISTISHQMAEGLCFLMGGLGIMATYRTQKARRNWKPEIIVRIYREFCYLLPDITLKRKDKAAKKLASSTSRSSYDSVPIPESHYSRKLRKMASSRSRIRRINNGKDETLTKLCDKPMWWDMVDEVVPIPSEDYVYDLDMQPTSTFVVNTGIVVHNSFEDAHVISESAAKKMATDRMYSTDVETRNGVVANKNKYIAAFPNKFTKQQFETLDEDGMAKVGTELHKGDPIVVALGPRVLSSADAQLGKLSKTLRNAFTDKAEVWEHDWPGVVTDAVMTSKGARVNVKTTPPVKVGDKLCYSDDTQVLTEDGWKNIADLTLEDKVCTLNPENRIFEYVNPAQLEKYEHDGKMYSIRSKHIDLMVTLDHNMYVDIGEGFRFYKAEEIVGKKAKYLKTGLNGNMIDETESVIRIAGWGDPAYVGCRYAADKLQQDYLHAGMAADVVYDGFKYKVTKCDGDTWVNEDHEAPEDMVVDYDGYVYCCTMPKWHIIYVRRNGKACWSGNSGRFGLKGVTGSIIPDDKMPRDAATNQPYDMLINPMGFLSRVAPGQLMEIALGKVAKHTGQQVRLPQLPPPEGWAIWTKAQLDQNGLKDSTDIFDPETGKTIKNVGDGYMFVSAFHHLAEKKASSRGTEASYTQDDQPAKGGSEGAKRMCFVAEQEIRVLHGEESIGHICDKKIPALVWTELTPGNWGYSQITDWFVRKGKMSDVLSIQVNGLPVGSTTVSRRNVMYGRKVLRCTKEHIIYTPDRGGVKAGDLKVGDFVSSYGYVPTKDQMSLLYGSMLGDGCISNINNEYIPGFTEEHSHHQANYVNWKIASLGNLVSSRKSTCSKSSSGFGPKGTRCSCYTVHRADIAIKLRDEFYKKDGEFCQKHVGNIDLDSLTDVAIVAWFLDDGCISEHRNDPGHLSGSIATNSFSIEDVDRLVDWLNRRIGERFYRYEIHGKYKGESRTYQTIRMSDKACYKMAELVAKYIKADDIPDTKKWLRKRVEELKDTYIGVDTAYTLGTVPVIVSAIEPYSDGKHGPDDEICLYDVTVAGCHRYCASDVLVSNSGLDLYALLSHGATDVIKDYVTVRGTKNEQYWNALRLGLPIPEPGVPFIYNKFLNTLKAGGINVVEKGNITQILPLTDKDIDQLSGSRLITSSAMVDSDLEPVRGGLFDPGKTGGNNGNFWSAIPLPEPVPNPIMEEPIRRVLGLTTKKLEAVLSGEEQLNGKTGGEAIKDALKHIDIDDKIAQARLDIKNRRGSVRDNAVKVLGYLNSMKEQGLEPSDWMISKVPVLPPKFRPASKLGDVIMVSDINDLYKEVIENAKNFEELHKDLPDSATTNERLNLYRSVKAAYGLGESITPEGQAKGLKGAIRQVIGSSPKFGMFQRKVISKTVDTVSRNAVTPDPNLDMDQVGIPENSAWEMYKPFVMRALVRRGYPPVTAIQMLDKRDATARQMLEEEMEKRPVLMDRAPTWHKFNILAFKPSIVDSETVHVSPLIVSGFNMDFDGDTVNFHVPVSDKAVKQANEKMMPSQNLISLTDLQSARHPVSKEQILGLFNLTQPENNKPVKVFRTKEDAKMAYARGEIDMNDPIEILR